MLDLTIDHEIDSSFYDRDLCMHINQKIVKCLGGSIEFKYIDDIGTLYILNVPVMNVNTKANEPKFYLNLFIKDLIKFSDTMELISSQSINQ